MNNEESAQKLYSIMVNFIELENSLDKMEYQLGHLRRLHNSEFQDKIEKIDQNLSHLMSKCEKRYDDIQQNPEKTPSDPLMTCRLENVVYFIRDHLDVIGETEEIRDEFFDDEITIDENDLKVTLGSLGKTQENLIDDFFAYRNDLAKTLNDKMKEIDMQ